VSPWSLMEVRDKGATHIFVGRCSVMALWGGR
jgi:hypothetical protein